MRWLSVGGAHQAPAFGRAFGIVAVPAFGVVSKTMRGLRCAPRSAAAPRARSRGPLLGGRRSRRPAGPRSRPPAVAPRPASRPSAGAGCRAGTPPTRPAPAAGTAPPAAGGSNSASGTRRGASARAPLPGLPPATFTCARPAKVAGVAQRLDDLQRLQLLPQPADRDVDRA